MSEIYMSFSDESGLRDWWQDFFILFIQLFQAGGIVLIFTLIVLFHLVQLLARVVFRFKINGLLLGSVLGSVIAVLFLVISKGDTVWMVYLPLLIFFMGLSFGLFHQIILNYRLRMKSNF
ncbi:hypothetical protein WJR50_18305 [Catalinimonas sp. 4WD22]|uniref:hypothetical protein n=1 Tax=Catalinimonas locisalis TaxID=3133978 RepID=UPI003101759F